MFEVKLNDAGELTLYYGTRPLVTSHYPARLQRICRMLTDEKMVKLAAPQVNGQQHKLDNHEIALQNGSFLVVEDGNVVVEENGKTVFQSIASNLDLNRLLTVMGKSPVCETPIKLKDVRVQNESGKYEVLSVFRTKDGKLVGLDKTFLEDLDDDTVPHPYSPGVEMFLHTGN